ncbi:U3 small nucleolar RNA-associated protein 18 homolog [Ostrea edulis]|uniref:U3 small nucleolar RNA-associated protein 18 homolog n=1 Tax=Ostrea edulis TaxID=37623 RepID=UPI002095AECA|nr:U3 small nucleolar RNA-associated protein 18 homolog [Ostrea edulis]
MLRRKKKSILHSSEAKITQKESQIAKIPLGSKRKGKDAEEAHLEKLVLGGDNDVIHTLQEASEKAQHESQTKKKKIPSNQKTPAWQDDDDVRGSIKITKERRFDSIRRRDERKMKVDQYTSRLKNEFEKVSSVPNWAKLPSEKTQSSDDDSDVDDLLQKTGNYLATSSALPRGLIDLKQCTDANKEQPSESKLKSVEFHPTAQVILTAGMNCTLNLFQVDGKQNPKIQSVFIDGFPIHTAHFSTEGHEVIMGSRYKNIQYYDMMAGKIVNVPKIKGLEEKMMKKFKVSPDGRFLVFLGKTGGMHLLSAKSKEWIHTLQMNGEVKDVAFSQDGHLMYSHGVEGDVYVWDLDRRDCIHRFYDDGCTHGTSIAISPNGQYLACGSYSGVVNIYDSGSILNSRSPKPVKAVMNLTTPCTNAVFNSSSEILAISSNYAEKAVKLVHAPSMTVFSNFPERKVDSLRIPTCMDFSLNGGYFSIGTHRGCALLYRVKHYGNY